MANRQLVRPHKPQAALVGLAAEAAGFSVVFSRRAPHKDKSAPLVAHHLALEACSSRNKRNLKILTVLKARSARVSKERLARELVEQDFSDKVELLAFNHSSSSSKIRPSVVKDYGAINLPVNLEPQWVWDSSRACQLLDKQQPRVLSELEAAEAQVVCSKVLVNNRIHLVEASEALVNSRRNSQALTNLKNLLCLAVSRPRRVYSSQADLDKIKARGSEDKAYSVNRPDRAYSSNRRQDLRHRAALVLVEVLEEIHLVNSSLWVWVNNSQEPIRVLSMANLQTTSRMSKQSMCHSERP